MSVMRRRGGFTLIELLVVILILAILLAIAIPLYLRAVRDSELKTCHSNMQTIATAVQAYRVHVDNHSYPADLATLVAPVAGETLTDLQAVPVCPTGGSYSVVYDGAAADPADPSTVEGYHINCSDADHGDFYPSGIAAPVVP